MPLAKRGVSSTLTQRIVEALDDHHILHGRLREGTPHLNLNLTDRAHVFVKISRPAERTNRPETELAGARWASRHGLRTVLPLLDRVLDIDDEQGETRAVTVWAWHEPMTAPGLIDQIRAVADLTSAIAAVEPPDVVATFDLPFFDTRIRHRLDGNRSAEAATIMAAADQSGAALAARLAPDTYTWIHGDLHTHNILWPLSGRPIILDWESHVLGPIEWDIAQLVRSARMNFPHHDQHEQSRALTDATRRLNAVADIDWELVDLCTRFRSASSASHLLIHGHQPDRLARDLTLLTAPAAPAAPTAPTALAGAPAAA